jgi:sulfide:quinone oxidoreductase
MSMAKRVVVVGGGNAGSIVANVLNERGIDVTVVERSNVHVYQPGIIDVAFGEVPLERIVKPVSEVIKAKVVKDSVTRVDVENHQVVTASGKKIDYDYVVMSAGVENAKLEGFPEWHSLEGVTKLRDMINGFSGKKIVVGYYGVIKCPAAPFEFAFLLRKRFPNADIALVNPVANPPEIQRPMAEMLGKVSKELKIKVIRGFKIKEIDRNNRVIFSEDGQKLEYDMALIDTPIRAGKEFDNLVDSSGFIPVDKETLRYKDYDNVFAVGDITNIMIPPKTGALAHFEAKLVANNIYADINGFGKEKFDGSAMCAVYGSENKGMFIKMNYQRSFALGPSTAFYLAKKAFIGLYWLTLTGKLL